MKRAICVLTIGLMFVLGSTAAQAAPPITVNGLASGLELCPQFICGIAIFTGVFHGQIGINPNATGIVTVALNHTDLPTLDNKTEAIIKGGVWQLQSFPRGLAGIVLGGTINISTNDNGDGKLFDVQIFLRASDGGTTVFNGTLDHHPLIPRVAGSLTPFP
jgi:hypothetical protein